MTILDAVCRYAERRCAECLGAKWRRRILKVFLCLFQEKKKNELQKKIDENRRKKISKPCSVHSQNGAITISIMALSMTSHCIKLNDTENYGTWHDVTKHKDKLLNDTENYGAQHNDTHHKDKPLNDTKNYAAQRNDTHHKDKQLNDTKNYGTRHNDTHHKDKQLNDTKNYVQ